VVQPGFYVFDVRARDDSRWFGKNLRVELRGAEFFVNDEGERGRRASARKTWRRGTRRFTLGGEVAMQPAQPDRGLLELGVAAGGLGFDFYPGHARRALLVHAGALHFGFVWRGIARGATHATAKWQVLAPLPQAALEDPRQRWPGLATL
jgi:hypothetical protein